jgi:hypothetical protein
VPRLPSPREGSSARLPDRRCSWSFTASVWGLTNETLTRTPKREVLHAWVRGVALNAVERGDSRAPSAAQSVVVRCGSCSRALVVAGCSSAVSAAAQHQRRAPRKNMPQLGAWHIWSCARAGPVRRLIAEGASVPSSRARGSPSATRSLCPELAVAAGLDLRRAADVATSRGPAGSSGRAPFPSCTT